MFSREINIKASDVPPGWSIEAADFVNKLLRRRSKERLGKGGINELKEHSWLRGIQWKDIYRKEVFTPYVPGVGDNFDKAYCNKVDVVDKLKYDYFLSKINNLKLFKKYYFNYYLDNQDICFLHDNLAYKFTNVHEEGYDMTLGRNIRNSLAVMTTHMHKSGVNNGNLSHTFNMDVSNLTLRKLKS